MNITLCAYLANVQLPEPDAVVPITVLKRPSALRNDYETETVVMACIELTLCTWILFGTASQPWRIFASNWRLVALGCSRLAPVVFNLLVDERTQPSDIMSGAPSCIVGCLF